MLKKTIILPSALIASGLTMPAVAQEAGEVNIQTSVARTKLVDKGTVLTDGVEDPAAAYKTREAYHSIVTLNYFPVDQLSIDASISSPATTNNIPAGSLTGLPNLGDDEFIMATIGASFYPVKGPVRPYVGGGLATQITTQERDGLAVGLNIPNAHGPYVNAGVKAAVGPSFDIFFDVRKAWYSTHGTGLLPLDDTYTSFAQVDAFAELDPLTIQVGLGTRFGHSSEPAAPVAPRETGDIVGKFGVTNLRLRDELALEVGGTEYPGSGMTTFEHQTVTAQFAYYFTEQLAANVTVGVPPTIDIYGAGTIGALPKLGEITYGPTTLTLQWHPVSTGRIRPYAGVGAAYLIVLDTDDGAFSDLEVDNDLGLAFELGVDIQINDTYGLFLEAKKAYLQPEATGTFGGAEVVGQSKLDPWAISTGVGFNF